MAGKQSHGSFAKFKQTAKSAQLDGSELDKGIESHSLKSRNLQSALKAAWPKCIDAESPE